MKVYVDNYLEGYHIPIVHPELFKELDYRAYKVETAEYHSKQHAPIRSKNEDSLYRRNLAEGAEPEALYYWIFPNMMLNLYPDNLQTNLILPLGPDRTLTRFEWFVLEPNSPGVAEEFARSFACNFLAACEVLARLRGHPGYQNAFTKKVDQWVAAHALTPSRALLTRALKG